MTSVPCVGTAAVLSVVGSRVAAVAVPLPAAAPLPVGVRLPPLPRPVKNVVYVKDAIISISATGVAGNVSQTQTVTDLFVCESASFDGSAATAKVTGLAFHKHNVLGPLVAERAIPAVAFSGNSPKTLGLKGYRLKPMHVITLSGVIANDNDVLQMLLYGKEKVDQPC